MSPRLAIIDVPQVVELISDPHAMDLCSVAAPPCALVHVSGFPVDEGELVTDQLGHV